MDGPGDLTAEMALPDGVAALLYVDGGAGGENEIPLPGARLRPDQVASISTLYSRVEDDMGVEVVQLPGTLGDRALYAVPVVVGRRVAGCLVVGASDDLTPEQRASLASAAASRALELMRLGESDRARAARRVAEAIAEITRTVARSAQLPTLVPVLAARAARALSYGRGTVLLVDRDRMAVAGSQHAGGQPDMRMWGALRAVVPEPAALRAVVDSGRPAVFSDPGRTADLAPDAWVRPLGIKTMVAAPIVVDDGPMGVLLVDDERKRRVTDEDVDGLMAIAAAGGDAIATIGLLQDERAALHRSQLVLGTVVQAATQLNTSGVLTVIGEGINKVLDDETTVSYVIDGGVPSRLVVCGLGDGVLDMVDRVTTGFPGEGSGEGSDFIVMSRGTHPRLLEGTVAGRAVALPLRRAARELGWVVSYSPEEAPYVDADLKIVAGIAAQAALSLHTALLLEQERAAITRLEELGDLKTQFVASVSHELRTPLTAIIGYTELMLEILDDPTLRTYLDDMRRESTALEALINDLLDTSRIEGGTLRLEVKVDDPTRALHEAVELVRHSHPGRAVQVDVDEATGLLPIDHSRLRQIITNLVDNAVKYSPEDSVVSVGMRRAADAQRGEHVEVTVTDRGPGIPVSQREAVFQRFNRLHTTTHAGTGIGLYLVRALVEAHGGTVKVGDVPGSTGSRFVVRLPCTT